MTETRTAAQILVDCLVAQGTSHAFCVPGESYLAVLDALYDARNSIQLVTGRHEAGVANMAEAHGKLTGRPGVAFVTRGPGATHAAIGVHTAKQDSTPLILFIGQIDRATRDREAFQEVDYRAMFGTVAKWVAEIDDASRMAEYVTRAFAVAMNGRPGPVVLALPEDMLVEAVPARVPPRVEPVRAAAVPADIARIEALLARARRPLVVLGGSGWSAAGLAAVQAFAEANRLPVATGFRRKALIDNRHPCYVGELGLGPNPKLAARTREADLLIVLGSRLSEVVTSGYTLVEAPLPRQTLVHVHPDSGEIGRVYQAEVGIAASLDCVAAALAAVRVDSAAWAADTATARADYEAWVAPVAVGEGVNLAAVMAHLAEVLPEDAILTNGAGNFAAWLHRFYEHRRPGTQLAPTNGAMGYGLPAAVAAKLVDPARTVVCIADDGDFQMSFQELSTAAQYGAAIIVLVANNGVYGTIRMHQDREYPGRVSGTTMMNPDFAALARAYGGHGARVERTEDFPAAFAQARAAGTLAVLDLAVSPKFISPTKTLSDL